MNEAEIISGLGSRASVIHAIADAEKRGLSREELALCACAGNGARLGEVLERSGLPEARAIALLLGLRLRGIIHPGPARQTQMPEFWKGFGSSSTPKPRAPIPSSPLPRATGTTPGAMPARHSPAPTPAAIDHAALSEQVDLDDARKREILELEARLDSSSFFAILGVQPGADPAAVKKAYYELTKRFHPDRYFGKSLGSFKARIERIFKRLTEAQSVLCDPAKRKAYLAAHPDLAPAAPAPLPRRDDPHAAERRARLARHPYLAKRVKFNELIAKGRELIAKGDFAKALSDLSLATQIDPKDAEAARLLTEARKGGDRGRAQTELDESISSDTLGDKTRALAHLRKAVQLDPDNPQYCDLLARTLLQSGTIEALKEAHLHARRATELASENADYHSTFANVLVRAGLEKNAIREYEQVVRLRPDDTFARDQVRKLKLKTRIIS
jgi:curved DNA-binding protein CbpA